MSEAMKDIAQKLLGVGKNRQGKALDSQELQAVAKEQGHPSSPSHLMVHCFGQYWETEFTDLFKVFELGARKYGNKNWTREDGAKSSHREMCDSMFHHLAEAYSGSRTDDESGLDPLLHLTARALMLYARRQRGLE